MNILIITFQGDYSGATNSITYLSEGLANKGHNVYVGCRVESLLYKNLENSRAKLIPMTFTGKLDRVNMRQIRDAVKTYNIELINAQSSQDRYTSILAKWIYKLNVKIVHTRRQTPLSIGGWFQNQFYVKGTNKIVTVSNELKKTFVKKGIPENHISVIFNGTPAEKFKHVKEEDIQILRKKFNISENEVVIGCVSRMKKQDQLIRAMAYLDPSYTVMFVGVEPGSLDALARELNIKNRILYAGIVDSKSVISYYPLFKVDILPSTSDGFGLVLVEAMAMGTPVIGTRYEGIIDVIEDGESGFLFEDGNSKDLAEKIERVLTDQALREKFIANGKIAALQKFSMERTIGEYEKLFAELIDKGN